MVKISDFGVNQQCELVLVVLAATARKTRAGKPYLVLDLFDGTDKITGNYWDWSGKAIPENNAILNVTAQVTEYNGNKQLNISGLSTNTSVDITEFAVSSGHDLDALYDDACQLIESVLDLGLKELALMIMSQLKVKWLTIPGAKGIHHAYVGGTLVHSLSVAKISRSIAAVTPGANMDLCTVGGMLHDIGKLFTYKMDGVVIGMTDEGMLFEHLFMGAEFIGNFVDNNIENGLLNMYGSSEEKTELLRHIILSHHGNLEHGSPVTPMSIEAYIVHHADMIDATAEQIRDGSKKATGKFTDRLYVLNNRPHLTVQYVEEVME